MLLQAILAFSLVVSSLKSVCCDFYFNKRLMEVSCRVVSISRLNFSVGAETDTRALALDGYSPTDLWACD